MKRGVFFILLLSTAMLWLSCGRIEGPDFPDYTSPRVLIQSVSKAPGGTIPIHYSIVSTTGLYASITTEFSINGSYSICTLVNSSQTTGLSSSIYPGKTHVVYWDSVKDIANISFDQGVTIRITACDTVNISGGTPGEIIITGEIFNVPPSTATTPSPYYDEKVYLDVVLSWDNSSLAEGYYVYFGETSPPEYATKVLTPSFNPGTLNAGTFYYWRVIPYNEFGNASNISTWRFQTRSLPLKATDPDPVDGATGIPLDQDLDWDRPYDIISFDVYLGKSENLGPEDFQDSVASPNTYYSLDNLSIDTTYYWRIDTINSVGKTTGDVWWFRTRAYPRRAINPDPHNGAKGVMLEPVFTWIEPDPDNLTSYDIYFGNNASLVSGNYKGNQIDTFYKPEKLEYLTTYYWRIDTVNTGNTTTGDLWCFRTGAAIEDLENGDLIWVKHIPGGGNGEGKAISAFLDNTFLISGTISRGSSTFGKGEENETTLSCDKWGYYTAKYNKSGAFDYAKLKCESDLYREGARMGVSLFPDGKYVEAGWFSDNVTLGAGESNETILYSQGRSDMYVALYNKDGTLVWAKRAGETLEENAFAVTCLDNSSFIVSGTYATDITFGAGEENETTLSNSGFFLARYNINGSLQWAKRIIADNVNDEIAGLDVFDNSFYIGGTFGGHIIFDEGGSNETRHDGWGSDNYFVARYNSDGSLDWAKVSYAEGAITAAISVSLDGSAVVCGNFYGDMIVGLGEENETSLTSLNRDFDLCLVKYSPTGTLLWARRDGGNSSEFPTGMCTFSDDSIAVTGWYNGFGVFGSGDNNQVNYPHADTGNLFISRYDDKGAFLLAKRVLSEYGSCRALGIGALHDDTIVLTGYFSDTTTFGFGEINETTLLNPGYKDIFIARYKK